MKEWPCFFAAHLETPDERFFFVSSCRNGKSKERMDPNH